MGGRVGEIFLEFWNFGILGEKPRRRKALPHSRRIPKREGGREWRKVKEGKKNKPQAIAVLRERFSFFHEDSGWLPAFRFRDHGHVPSNGAAFQNGPPDDPECWP